MATSGERPSSGALVASVSAALGNPAAGADWSNVPGAGKEAILIRARLVTSATVANRQVQFQILDNAARLVFATPLLPAQAASATVDYFFNATTPTSAATGAQVFGQIPAIPLGAGWTIQTVTTLLQAGDQWSNITVVTAG